MESVTKELADFISERAVALDLSLAKTYEVFGTKKRFTRVVNRPETARLEDVLRLSHRLEVHPLEFIERYNLGGLMITEEDKLQLRTHYRVNPAPATPQEHYSPSSTTDHDETTPLPSPGNPACAGSPDRRSASTREDRPTLVPQH